MAGTRGRDHRLAATGGHLRGARCHSPGGGAARGEALGGEDLGGGQPADDQGHEGAGAGGESQKVHRYERTYGAFERTFRLSASIDANKIKATCDLGVLTITLPKAETAKPHLITVEVTPAKALNA